MLRQGSGIKGFLYLETSIIATKSNLFNLVQFCWQNQVCNDAKKRKRKFFVCWRKQELHLVAGYDIAEVSKNGKPLVENF